MSAGIIDGNCFRIRLYQFTFDPASVAANTTAEQTVTVDGIRSGDLVYVSKPTNTAGLFVSTARVSASDTLAITLGNCTASPIDAASEVWTITAIRPESGAPMTAGQF